MGNSKKAKTANSEERIDFAVGVITILAVVALFVGLFVGISNRSNVLGQIAMAGESEARRGNEQTFTCSVESDKVKDGDKVVWTVNGRKVSEGTYDSSAPLTLNYSPDKTGENIVSVKVGKYRQSHFVEVLPPKLTLTAPCVVITYGDEIPRLDFECNGFVDNDCREEMNYDGTCAIALGTASCNAQRKLNAGVYKIEFDAPCRYKDYDVDYVYGTLTVLPKTLEITNDFVKTYDQTNVIETPQINLDGVINGDDVNADCDKLYFDDKNAGCGKRITLANVELTGADSKNYALKRETAGTILPKELTIDGMKVKNKAYDGTTRVNLDKAGALHGVIEGDSVAIGSIDARFDEAFVGEREIVVDNVTLIGLDKDNYVLTDVSAEKAEITPFAQN